MFYFSLARTELEAKTKIHARPVPRWVWRRKPRSLRRNLWRGRYNELSTWSKRGYSKIHKRKYDRRQVWERYRPWQASTWGAMKPRIDTLPQPIRGYNSRFYMHSYYQMDAANINKTDGNGSKEDASSSEALEHASAFTYYFASTFLSAAKTFSLGRLNCARNPRTGSTYAE